MSWGMFLLGMWCGSLVVFVAMTIARAAADSVSAEVDYAAKEMNKPNKPAYRPSHQLRPSRLRFLCELPCVDADGKGGICAKPYGHSDECSTSDGAAP